MEIKDFLNVIGFSSDSDDVNIEDVTKHFQEKFVGRAVAHEDKDIINSVYGKRLGSLTTKLKNDFGLEKSEIDGKKIEEIIDLGLTKQNETILTLKSQLEETNVDEQVKAANEKALMLEKKYNDLNGLHTTLKQDHETFKQESNSTLKTHFINHAKNTQSSKVKFKEDLSDLERSGFNQLIGSKYQFDWEENDKGGELVINKDGTRVVGDKGDTFATYDEVLKREAKEANILALNGVKKDTQKIEHKAGNEPPKNGLRLGQNAQANAQRPSM